jgi:acetoin utilization deacetylase AcuC-like enzyme
LKAFYSDHIALPLPPGHRFPMAKYRLLRQRVEATLPGIELEMAPAASDRQLAFAHDPGYVANVMRGRLSAREQRAIGFHWSEQLVERSRRSVGATIAASRCAAVDSVAVNLAGGTHHAHADSGQGYCVFNDVAVAARMLQAQSANGSLRVAIIDLDVHQGNGTASIFARDPATFTLSLHGESNFPFRKEPGDLDVPLPDGTDDAQYLSALDKALEELLCRFQPEFVLYLAGADAHQDDRLGRLSLTTAGLRERDRRIFDLALHLQVPVAVTMAGGYGRHIETTIAIHLNTVAEAFAHWLRVRPRQSEGATS